MSQQVEPAEQETAAPTTKKPRKVMHADKDGLRSPETLDEAKRLRTAGENVETENLSVDDKRKYLEWLENFQASPDLAPLRGNDKLAWLMRPTKLVAIAGSDAKDGMISSSVTLKIDFDESELKLLPLCIATPAMALLKESRRTDSGKNSSRIFVGRDWRTMSYRFHSPSHDKIQVQANIKGEPEFSVVQDKSDERLQLKIKLVCDVSGNVFAQLAQMLKSNALSTEAFQEQLSLIEH